MPSVETARAFRDMIEEHFFDANGILMYNLNRRTMRPFTDAELEGCAVPHNDGSPAGRWTYEDTMFCTGLYFWALAEEYRVTGDGAVLALLQRHFDDILPLIEANSRIEAGYIGKPWGGRPQMATTIDQTFYFCFGLHHFIGVADSGRAERARETLVGNVDWWIRHGYRNFGHPEDVPPCWLGASHGGAMLANVHLAFLHTGDAKYRAECDRLNREHRTDEFPCRRSPQWCPVDDSGYKTRRMALWHHAYAPALWLLAREWPERRTWWQERFADQWHREMKLGLRPDGFTSLCVRVNLADETEAPIEPHEAHYFASDDFEERRQRNVHHHLWIGAARSRYFSSHVAASALLLADAAPWMAGEARRVLAVALAAAPDDMLWAVDPDGRQLPDTHRHLAESLTVKGMVPWLAAYWMARRMGLIPET